MLVIGN